MKAGPGTAVYAGTLDLSSVLSVRVLAASEGTLLAEISRLLENAVQARSRYVQLADRAARLYAPVVHAAAVLTILGWVAFAASWHDAVITAISVLIITCPCVLGLAIPAVQTVASDAMFRSGVLLNSGDAIERLAEVDRVVFDKMGTLTLPEHGIANAASIPESVFEPAGRLALASHHPVAAAVARAAKAKTPLAGVEEISGQGVQGFINGFEVRLGITQAVILRYGSSSQQYPVRGPRGVDRRLSSWRGTPCLCCATAVAPRCSQSHRHASAGRYRGRDIVRGSRARGAARRPVARNSRMACGGNPCRQDCAYRRAQTAGHQGHMVHLSQATADLVFLGEQRR